MCYSPLSLSLLISPSGSRSVVFSPKNFSPGDYVDNDGYRHISFFVPCRKCLECKASHAREWAVRCMHELKNYEKSCFITLTYDDAHLPSGGTLVKSDLQKFWKRLRKKYGKFRYFACGEYGEQFQRPHYHAIIFGLDFPPDERNSQGVKDNKALSAVWHNGITSCDDVNFNTACYVARYCVKKLSPIELGDRLPEFVVMSTVPGIGYDYGKDFGVQYMEQGFLMNKGFKLAVPRYYEKVQKKIDKDFYDYVKADRLNRMRFQDLDFDKLRRKEKFCEYNQQRKRKGM